MLHLLLMGLALSTHGVSESSIADDEGSTSYYSTPANVGTPVGDGVYAFSTGGGPQLRIRISTYGICGGRQKAFGYITSFEGSVQAYPDPPSNYLSVSYSYCSTPYNSPSCTSLCCSWLNGTYSGYLYKDGTLSDGSPRFIISPT